LSLDAEAVTDKMEGRRDAEIISETASGFNVNHSSTYLTNTAIGIKPNVFALTPCVPFGKKDVL